MRLLDESNVPVEGWCGFTDPRGRIAADEYIAEGTYGTAGRHFARLPPGEWTLRARATGYLESERAVRVERGGSVDLFVRLEHAAKR